MLASSRAWNPPQRRAGDGSQALKVKDFLAGRMDMRPYGREWRMPVASGTGRV